MKKYKGTITFTYSVIIIDQYIDETDLKIELYEYLKSDLNYMTYDEVVQYSDIDIEEVLE